MADEGPGRLMVFLFGAGAGAVEIGILDGEGVGARDWSGGRSVVLGERPGRYRVLVDGFDLGGCGAVGVWGMGLYNGAVGTGFAGGERLVALNPRVVADCAADLVPGCLLRAGPS